MEKNVAVISMIYVHVIHEYLSLVALIKGLDEIFLEKLFGGLSRKVMKNLCTLGIKFREGH